MALTYSRNPLTGEFELVSAGPTIRSKSLRKCFRILGLPIVLASLGLCVAMTNRQSKSSGPRQILAPGQNAVSATRDDLSETIIFPRIGGIAFGAYAGEAAQVAGIKNSSTAYLYQSKAYRRYRQSIRNVYGVDLMDMNYFSVGTPHWESRIPMLQKWMLMAADYGEVTLAIEPLGKNTYDVFRDSSGMQALRSAFETAEDSNVKVVVRFASEANLRGSEFSAHGTRGRAEKFYNAACWFKEYMPKNIELVFSPLINTAVLEEKTQRRTIRWMFCGVNEGDGEAVPWDRIGGTIYRTTVSLKPTYEKYYEMMSELNQSLPFQICELGGPYRKRIEMLTFLDEVVDGRWPRVEKVNLFARDINRRADPNGHFGFIEPTQRSSAIRAVERGEEKMVFSYLKPFFAKYSAQSR